MKKTPEHLKALLEQLIVASELNDWSITQDANGNHCFEVPFGHNPHDASQLDKSRFIAVLEEEKIPYQKADAPTDSKSNAVLRITPSDVERYIAEHERRYTSEQEVIMSKNKPFTLSATPPSSSISTALVERLNAITGLVWQAQTVPENTTNGKRNVEVLYTYPARNLQADDLEMLFSKAGLSPDLAVDGDKRGIAIRMQEADKLVRDRTLQAEIRDGMKAKGFDVGPALY